MSVTDIFDKTQTLLRVWVFEDLKTMTFRMLSREVGINVNEAKTQLATFAAANPKDVHPTWILTGSLIPPPAENSSMDVDGEDGEGGKAIRMGVLLCTEDDIELKKTLFHPETLSQHVYSLALGLLRDPATLIKTSTALRSHPKYLRPEIYGTSVSASISSGPAHKVPTSAATAAAPAAKGKGRDAPAAASASEKAKPKMTAGKLDFSKNQSKEQKDDKKVVEEKAKASLKRKTSPSGDAPKANTIVSVSKPAPDSPPPKAPAKGKTKTRAVLSDDEEEDIAPKKATTAGASTKKKLTKAEMDAEMAGLDSIWDDDMDVDENGEEIVNAAPTKKKSLITSTSESDSEPAPKPKPAAAKAAPKKKAVLADGSGDEQEDVKPTAKALSTAGKAKKAAGKKGEEKRDAQGRLRKVRRVVKTVTGKNKRGYDVEEDVSAEESYYTSEDEAPAAPSARPKAKATTSSTSVNSAGDAKEKKPMQKVERKPVGKKPSGQASISSFFGKK